MSLLHVLFWAITVGGLEEESVPCCAHKAEAETQKGSADCFLAFFETRRTTLLSASSQIP
jgi:hypothetical protein